MMSESAAKITPIPDVGAWNTSGKTQAEKLAFCHKLESENSKVLTNNLHSVLNNVWFVFFISVPTIMWIYF